MMQKHPDYPDVDWEAQIAWDNLVIEWVLGGCWIGLGLMGAIVVWGLLPA
jgi:hypothetical protein